MNLTIQNHKTSFQGKREVLYNLSEAFNEAQFAAREAMKIKSRNKKYHLGAVSAFTKSAIFDEEFLETIANKDNVKKLIDTFYTLSSVKKVSVPTDSKEIRSEAISIFRSRILANLILSDEKKYKNPSNIKIIREFLDQDISRGAEL